jgi:uncharacterized protein (DUF4415 family)
LDELAALAEMPDDEIDTGGIPEVRDWTGAERGLFHRPLKQQLTLRLDADTIAWFRAHASENEGYQTGINRALREYVQQHRTVSMGSRQGASRRVNSLRNRRH